MNHLRPYFIIKIHVMKSKNSLKFVFLHATKWILLTAFLKKLSVDMLKFCMDGPDGFSHREQ
jgi:hypothetical protein